MVTERLASIPLQVGVFIASLVLGTTVTPAFVQFVTVTVRPGRVPRR